jgi:hypothetical protein
VPIKPLQLPSGQAAGSVLSSKDAFASLEWNPNIDFVTLDGCGESHFSEYGPSVVDFGIAQKVASALQLQLRSCALGGAYHSAQDLGNGNLGDAGWAHIANEYNRQEQSSQKANTSSTGAYSAGIPVAARDGITAGEYLVWESIATPANTEIVQVSTTYVPATGAGTVALVAAPVHTHANLDPVYHACRNEGYLAKSSLVIVCAEGYLDLAIAGPGAAPATLNSQWQSGTFGTTNGASTGLSPFMHALRFTICNFRCSVIYASNHLSNHYGTSPGAWTNFPVTANTASFPTLYTPFNGGNTGGSFQYASASGDTMFFSTAPDFPGGVVNVFFAVGNSFASGAVLDYSVAGATTVAMTSHAAGTVYDNRGQNNAPMNSAAAPAGFITGTVMRIPALNAGVNTITIKATTINASSLVGFLGWGPEAPIPPLINVIQPARVPIPAATWYGIRTRAATGATVLAGHGATAGDVTFTGGTVALGTAGTPSATAAQINDTITLDKGNAALEETRRIVSYTGSPATACQVDHNFVNAHTAATFVLGLQDADYMGGGYFNAADAQGKLSVPGTAGAIASVVSEFDASVLLFNADAAVNPPGGAGSAIQPLNFYWDGLHYNDQGSALIAEGLVAAIVSQSHLMPQIVSPTVPNRRTFQWVYGDAGATPAASVLTVSFVNSWTNVFSSTFTGATTYPRTGYFKDPRTRYVTVRGAVLGNVGTGTTIFTLPVGYRPVGPTPLAAYSLTTGGVYSPAIVMVNAAGAVICESTIVATSALVFDGTYPAEA